MPSFTIGLWVNRAALPSFLGLHRLIRHILWPAAKKIPAYGLWRAPVGDRSIQPLHIRQCPTRKGACKEGFCQQAIDAQVHGL